MPRLSRNQICLLIVSCCSFVVALALGVAAWDINFWPTDARVYYFDAAVQLPQLSYLSSIHETIAAEKVRWLHGKEIFILCISLMQRLIQDTETLRPFLLVCLIATCLSSILIYCILQRLWGPVVGCVGYFAFSASLWPYVYILFAKHQPLGLFFFLLGTYLLFTTGVPWLRRGILYVSGLCVGLSLFSSTVASLYVPFYAAAFVLIHRPDPSSGQSIRRFCKEALGPALCVGLGLLTAFGYVNYPDILQNLKRYIEYVDISGAYNHFYYNQAFLQQWFPLQDVGQVRGGLLWIVKYFFVITPVLFPVYLFSVGYLIVCMVKAPLQFRIQAGLMILLSMAPPLMAEIAQVAQYGANYFPSLIGMVLLVAYVAHGVGQDERMQDFWKTRRPVAVTLMALAAGAHLLINGYTFLTDVYPTRMATTFLSRKIKELGSKKIYTPVYNPQHSHFVLYVNPDVARDVKFVPIEFIIQPQQGYIQVPPISGDSIYIASISTYTDFDDDAFLNELVRKGNLPQYAVASFKTLAGSRIWLHEEEIFSYRRLILNHPLGQDNMKTRVWLLDGKRIFADMKSNIPIKEYLNLFQKNVRNIGTKKRIYLYEGYTGRVQQPKPLLHLLARVHKIGNPTDSLIAYVYKIDDQQDVWVPIGKQFRSQPLPAARILRDAGEGLGVFQFDPPLELKRGSYFFMIYRTGSPDDKNYYRIHNEYIGML